MARLVLFQPDNPRNVGGAIRTAACFGAALDIIEPCGFPLTDKAVRAQSLDYGGRLEVRRWSGWDAYHADCLERGARRVLLTVRASGTLWDTPIGPSDHLILGRESAGVPGAVHAAVEAAARIPIIDRSLNMVVAAGVALAEAARQAALESRVQQ